MAESVIETQQVETLDYASKPRRTAGMPPPPMYGASKPKLGSKPMLISKKSDVVVKFDPRKSTDPNELDESMEPKDFSIKPNKDF